MIERISSICCADRMGKRAFFRNSRRPRANAVAFWSSSAGSEGQLSQGMSTERTRGELFVQQTQKRTKEFYQTHPSDEKKEKLRKGWGKKDGREEFKVRKKDTDI